MAAITSIIAACAQAPAPVPKSIPVANKTPEPVRAEAEPFVHPVPGARISSSFANYIVKSRNRKHHGTDFAAPIGTPVYATRSGVVLSADNTSLSGDFGNAVLIEHGDQFQSLSAHLSRIDVQMGTWVEAGQQIGLVGKTGRATGAHLHFEMWQNNLPKDPLQFLPIDEAQRLAVQKPQAAPKRVAQVEPTTTARSSTKQVKSSSKVAAKKTLTASNKRLSSKAVAGKTKATARKTTASNAKTQTVRSKRNLAANTQQKASKQRATKTSSKVATVADQSRKAATVRQTDSKKTTTKKASTQKTTNQELRNKAVASPNESAVPRKQPDRPR